MALLSPAPTPRRGFLQRLAAAGTAALAAGGWPRALAAAPAGSAAPLSDDAWLNRIRGKYRQVFDCVEPNGGFGAAYALNFIDSAKDALKLVDGDIAAVVVFRHLSMPLTLNDGIWAKYKVGEIIHVNDPATGAPATRNVFRDNIAMRPGLTYEDMIARRGVVVVACNLALTVFSGIAGKQVGIPADQAKQEWTAGLLPGVALAPSGVYAVNRAQEKGCTYCYGG